ncbi:unnamed protein product, partial [Rotaria sordida]
YQQRRRELLLLRLQLQEL